MNFYSLLSRSARSVILIATLIISISSFAQKKKMPSDILESVVVVGLNSSDVVYTENMEYIISKLKKAGLKIGYYFHIKEHPTQARKDMTKASEAIKGNDIKYFLKFQLVFNSLQNKSVWFVYMSPILENSELQHYEKGYPRYSANKLDKLLERLIKSIH